VALENGRHCTIFACDFNEHVNLAWPGEKKGDEAFPPEFVAADVWLENVTVLNTLLNQLGFSYSPKVDHLWLGRATAKIPRCSEDMLPQDVLVTGGSELNSPMPKSVSISIKWIEDRHKS